jgi:hypothetical protein
MHAFPCTPMTKDAQSYVLQYCLGELMSVLRNRRDFVF